MKNGPQKKNYMKNAIHVIACSLVLGATPVFGQPENPDMPRSRVTAPQSASNAPTPAPLPKFDLKFPGGGPTDLVKAIEAASGKPLNVIISKQDEDTELPPLKMTGVNVWQLFRALELISVKSVDIVRGTGWDTVTTSYGFTTTGEPTESSIWHFHVQRPSSPPQISSEKTCRFFSLAPFLEHGFTVDDITTAIQTGWKMAKVPAPPELNYHKETMLLIAFGYPAELNTIDTVLRALPSSNATRNELDSMRQAIKDLRAQLNVVPAGLLPNPAR